MATLSDIAVSPPQAGADPDGASQAAGYARSQADAWRVVAASVVGAGVALSGFPPLNNIPAVLHVTSLPGFTVLTPAVLAALLALGFRRPGSLLGDVPRVALAAIVLLLVGGGLSLLHSARLDESAAFLVLGLLAPAILFVSTLRSWLPASVLAGSFLTGLTAALLRADISFLGEQGLPTPTKLFNAKFSNQAYDFHYYTLGNPDHTATFLLLPFVTSVLWAMAPQTSKRTRRWLLFAAAVMLFTLVLLYVRLPLLIAGVFVIGAVLRSRLPRRLRLRVAAGAFAVAAVFVVASPSHYLADTFSTQSSSSGGVRIASLGHGLRAMAHHPLTGVGLGEFGRYSGTPAHSSIVQAGADMGSFGLLGLLAMTIGLAVVVVNRIRHRVRLDLTAAALAGAAVYAVAAAVSAGADEGLLVGPISVYGLALAMFSGVALAPTPARATTGLGPSVRAIGENTRAVASQIRPGWLVYSILWFVVGAWLASRGLPFNLSGSRIQAFQQVLAADAHGFGPLVQQIGSGSFHPAGITDDPGGYLVVPGVSHLLGTQDIATIVRTSFAISFGAVLAAYPLLIRRLTGSAGTALVAPFIAFGFLRFLTYDGFYWVPALALAVCVPWLLAVIQSKRAAIPSLVGIALLAGVMQLFRSGTGYGLFAGAVIACIVARQSWRRRGIALAAVVAAFLIMSDGVLGLAYHSRGNRMHSYPVNTGGVAGVETWSDPSGHPFWHTAYIGLGVVSNRYGIRYDDSVAAAYVRSVDPTAPFVSPRYEAILRRRVLHLIRSDPGFVLRAETRKLEDVVDDGLNQVPLLFVLLPLALVLGLGRGRRLRYALATIPVLLVALGPPLLAVPSLSYELPWLTLLATGAALSACWIIGRAAEAVSDVVAEPRYAPALAPLRELFRDISVAWHNALDPIRVRAGRVTKRALRVLSWITRLGRRLPHALWSAARALPAPSRLVRSRVPYVAAAFVVGTVLARDVLSNWRASQSPAPGAVAAGAPTLPFRARLGADVNVWRTTAVPVGWSRALPSVQLQAASDHLDVSTSSKNDAYQLVSPTVTLQPGTYVAAVRGELPSGGLLLGVLGVKKDAWIAQNPFVGRSPAARVTMPLTFTLTAATQVRIILSNWNQANHPSRWQLNEILIAARSAGSGAAQSSG